MKRLAPLLLGLIACAAPSTMDDPSGASSGAARAGEKAAAGKDGQNAPLLDPVTGEPRAADAGTSAPAPARLRFGVAPQWNDVWDPPASGPANVGKIDDFTFAEISTQLGLPLVVVDAYTFGGGPIDVDRSWLEPASLTKAEAMGIAWVFLSQRGDVAGWDQFLASRR